MCEGTLKKSTTGMSFANINIQQLCLKSERQILVRHVIRKLQEIVTTSLTCQPVAKSAKESKSRERNVRP